MRKLIIALAALLGLGVAALAGYGGFTLASDESDAGAWSTEDCKQQMLTLAANRYDDVCRIEGNSCFLTMAALSVMCDEEELQPLLSLWTPTECQEARDLLNTSPAILRVRLRVVSGESNPRRRCAMG